jgi:hypothetical protein
MAVATYTRTVRNETAILIAIIAIRLTTDMAVVEVVEIAVSKTTNTVETISDRRHNRGRIHSLRHRRRRQSRRFLTMADMAQTGQINSARRITHRKRASISKLVTAVIRKTSITERPKIHR